MNILFMGTPHFASEILNGLYNSHHKIIAVITQPDRKGNRNKIIESEASLKAKELLLPVYKYQKISIEGLNDIQKLRPDIIVTAAYGQILSQVILDIAPYGVINVHGSLLPRYRGASPVQAALMDGAKLTGITIMQTVKKMDAGDILNYKICPIDKNDTQDSLFEKLAQCGKDILIKTLDDIENGTVKYFPQNKIKYNKSNKTFVKPSYCKKIKKQDELITWNKTAQKIHNQIRALSSNPTAYTILNGMIFKIYRSEVVENRSKNNFGEVLAFEKNGIIVGCEAGKIRIIEGCFQGGKRLYARDIINGKKIKIGDRFSIL